MRVIAVGAIRLYQRFLSPLLPRACRFEPSCSEYTRQAISRYGVIKGSFMGIWRLMRCHPFHPGGYDPVR
ncbi:MAG: membrane protein insertion efficiency factor YidD [Blastocatellia bacterium]|nr:membrane protein insertion efficiency factor YidD [Blastocatellia bacterium]MBK6426871.1 membrane protein insertion efficiency factor YidD [Blastocatellia bacterium]